MHRFIVSTLTALLILAVAPRARAALVCEDAVSQSGAGASYQWDELPEPSRAIFLALDACSCGVVEYSSGSPAWTPGACSSSCSFSDLYGDFGCGLRYPVCDPALDASCEYTWTQAQDAACAACIATTCADESAACMADGS